MGIKYVKSAARVLNRDCVNKGGLDLSKSVLWVSAGQGAADLRAVKVGGQKKILPIPRFESFQPDGFQRNISCQNCHCCNK